jgi:ribosomal protein S18 acetylase RimI-like enzyme
METYLIRTFNFAEDYPAVHLLWQNAGPGVQIGRSDSPEEILRKLDRDPDLFLVAEQAGQVVGSVLGGYDGRRGLVYHLAVTLSLRGQGIGEALMNEVEQRLQSKGCYKCYLLVVDGNQEAASFYQKRGWQAMPVTLFGKELLA